ncbi:MAG: porin family protein [bacterium]
MKHVICGQRSMVGKLALVLLFTFHFSVFTSQAQNRFDATVFAGLNMCQIDGDQSDGYGHLGLRAGVGTSFALGKDLSSPWRMVVELAFTNKGSHIKQFDRTISLSYIELPVMISYNAMENRLRLAAGVAPAVKVKEKITMGSNAEIGFIDNDFASIDWLPLTFSVRYLITDHFGFEARYQYSTLTVANKNSSGTYFLFRSNKGSFHNLVSFALTYSF